MRSWHKTAAVALLGLALVIAGVITARRKPSSEETFNRVSDRLSCRCGCGQHLNGCTHHPCGSADPMREEIRAGIAAGKSDEAIVQEFVQKMGAVVLAAPPAEGFSLVAWVMPIVALMVGLMVVFRIVRGARAPREAAPAAAGGSAKRAAVLDRYAAAIDEDLEREA